MCKRELLDIISETDANLFSGFRSGCFRASTFGQGLSGAPGFEAGDNIFSTGGVSIDSGTTFAQLLGA